MDKQQALKPQDVVLLAKLAISDGDDLRLIDISKDISVSVSEISEGVGRLQKSSLLQKESRQLNRSNCLEFIQFGLKYIFPPQLGAVTRGVATAHSGPALSKALIRSKHDKFVWPSDNGKDKGQSLIPLYPTVPEACLGDHELHYILSLLDALRVGRVREVKIAMTMLRRYF